MLREVEGLSVEETTEVLEITRETVKTRLARARRELQQELDSKLRNALQETFTFAGSDCDALTERVLATFIANGRKLRGIRARAQKQTRALVTPPQS